MLPIGKEVMFAGCLLESDNFTVGTVGLMVLVLVASFTSVCIQHSRVSINAIHKGQLRLLLQNHLGSRTIPR